VLALLSLIAWQSYLSLSIHAFVEVHDTPGGMGTPIGILREVARTIDRHTDAWDSRQVIALCPGDDPAMDEWPAVLQFISGRKLDVRFVDYDASLLFPQADTDALVVLTPGESHAASELPLHLQALPGQEIPLREGRGTFRFYRLPGGYKPWPPVEPSGAPVALENGVSLLGYALSPAPAPGQRAELTLYWHVDALPADPPPQGYSFANHLLAADGQRCGQADGPGYSVRRWRAGDTLLSWFTIPLAPDAPEAPYRLRVGMYVYTPPDRFTTIHVTDEGRPIADAVTWPIN
jgi:hypothetical protein